MQKEINQILYGILKFPINSLNIMRGYLFIDNETKDLYLNLIFDAYWKDNLDISNEEILKSILNKCKINPIISLMVLKILK